jgi:hypothetical protein
MAWLVHGSGVMERQRDTNPPSSVNRPRDRNDEPYLGGADAVEKTTGAGDVHGAGAHAPRATEGVTATVPRGGGPGALVWVLLALVVLVVLAYAIGLVA